MEQWRVPSTHPSLRFEQCLPLLVPGSKGGVEPPLCFVTPREHFFNAGLLKVATITKHNTSKKPLLRLSIITHQFPENKRGILDVITRGIPCCAGILL